MATGRSRVSILAQLDNRVSGPLEKIRGDFDRLGKSKGAQSVLAGVGMGAGLSAWNLVGSAIGKATEYIGDAIGAASDLAESTSKAQVVFGEGADEIEDWASRGAKAFGLSRQAALEAAGTYGNLFQAFGFGQTQAAGMSRRLVELAADLASFNNTSIEDALAALKSGLSGETEPLKRYGIALSDARMRQELMAQGVTDLGATLTPLQKTTAAYALVLKDSALAQGDFGRTSDGLANSQRILEAEMANAQATLGEKLLPIMTTLTQVAIGVVDAMGELGKAMSPPAKTGDTLRQRYERLTNQLKDDAYQAEQAADATDTLAAANRSAITTVDALDRSLGNLTDALFGTTIRAGELAQAQADLRDAKADRTHAKTAEEAAILDGKIAELTGHVMELEAEQARAAGSNALYNWVKAQEGAFQDADAAARTYLALLRGQAIGGADWQTLVGTAGYVDPIDRSLDVTGARASGGPVWPGRWLVGEDGPEILTLGPGGMGGVTPLAGRGGSGGSPVEIVVQVDGSELARVVDRHLYYNLTRQPAT